MVELPFSDQRWDNMRRYGPGGTRNDREYEACLLCGRPVYLDAQPKYIRMGTNNCAITDAEAAADPRLDQGCFVVGPECLRRHPELRPYAQVALGPRV